MADYILLDQIQPVGESSVGFGEQTGVYSRGQTFRPQLDNIHKIGFNMKSTGSKGMRISIGETVGGLPPSTATTSPLCQQIYTNGQLVTGFQRYELDTPCSVTPETEYYMIFEPWNTTTNLYENDYRDMGFEPDSYADGKGLEKGGATAWTSTNSNELQFETYSLQTITAEASTSTATTTDSTGTAIFAIGIMLAFMGMMFNGFIWNSFNSKKKWQ